MPSPPDEELWMELSRVGRERRDAVALLWCSLTAKHMGIVRSWNALASAEQRAPISSLRRVATFLLVFQVCLRILWMDVMPRCHNCQIEYMPENALRKEAIGTSSLSATGGSRKNHALRDLRSALNHIRYPAEEWSRHFSAAGRTGGSVGPSLAGLSLLGPAAASWRGRRGP